MVFCGQCGLQMAPGTARCPRCGAAVDNGQSAPNFDANGANDQTVESQSLFLSQPQAGRPYPSGRPSQSGGPQPILLRGSESAYSQQNAFDATSMVDVQTNMNPNAGMQQRGNSYTPGGNYPASQPSFPGMQPGAGNYPVSQPGFPGAQQPGGNYPASNPSFQVPNMQQNAGPYSHPGFAQQQQNMAFQGQAPESEPSDTKATSSRGRTTALVTILIGMLFVLVAMVLFIMQFNHMIG